MAGSFLGNALGGVIVIGVIYFFVWIMSKREERKLRREGEKLANERKAYTHTEIAENFFLWDKFLNYNFDESDKMTKEGFDTLSTERKTQMLTKRFGEINKK
jgi:hypothetical protein